MTKKPFICTVNFCRSQMAEGFGKAILGDEWNVYSEVLKHKVLILKPLKQ